MPTVRSAWTDLPPLGTQQMLMASGMPAPTGDYLFGAFLEFGLGGPGGVELVSASASHKATSHLALGNDPVSGAGPGDCMLRWEVDYSFGGGPPPGEEPPPGDPGDGGPQPDPSQPPPGKVRAVFVVQEIAP